MQVNNNMQSQNFGMALRIKPGARKALEECSMDTIKTVQKAGEDLKNTKFFHVTIDETGCKLESDKDAYFGLFKNNEYKTHYGEKKEAGKMVTADNIIMIENENGSTIAGVGRYVPYGKTEPFYNTWDALGSINDVKDVPVLSKLAKILDSVAIEKYNEQLAGKTAAELEKAEVSKAVGSLLDTFGE